MTDQREKSDIELSWESGKFEEDLRNLDSQIKKDIWAHDRLQESFQKEDFRWKGVISSLSIIFGVMIAVSKVYFPNLTPMLAEISLLAVIPAIMGLYTWSDPAGQRATHILVSGQKAGTGGKINLQLIKKPKYRELAEEFYRWIHEEYSRINGTSGSYIPGSLMAKYPNDKKSN